KDDQVDGARSGQRWYRIGDWPMALKLVLHTAGLAAALAVGLTAMGYIQAAQGLSERAEAALSSDALVVTTAIDDWNTQHLASLRGCRRLRGCCRARLTRSRPKMTTRRARVSRRWGRLARMSRLSISSMPRAR